jgi:hypothetical protein
MNGLSEYLFWVGVIGAITLVLVVALTLLTRTQDWLTARTNGQVALAAMLTIVVLIGGAAMVAVAAIVRHS